ncbi:MAG: potassium-transporting ATPase subunit KdpC [Elusimicrobia bacterium]|nr:potassium-transporting ATPase subunit KdpC [Elusimicrobiota bacterium]
MKLFKQSFLMNIWLTILLGLAYPVLMTVLAQVLFPRRANGSLIMHGGKVVGSELIGQAFAAPKYFHGRPSAAGSGYDGLQSGGSNLGPTSKALMARVDGDVARERKAEGRADPVPVDLVTASGSGLDPDISPSAALWQIPTVAKARGLDESAVRALVEKYTVGRTFGLLGEPRVNVLKLNLALDASTARAP